jgi:phosphatidylglycerophosphate synthase
MSANHQAGYYTVPANRIAAEHSGGFRSAPRLQEALTARMERQALIWLARHMPNCINSDHLTLLGFGAQFLAGIAYALARWNKYALLLVNVFLMLNWLGDSLDGTLARVRNHLRPRYGFYVDHIIDTFGAAFLMLGLAFSGYLHWQVALGMLVAFLILSVETYLATYTIGKFHLSHGPFGPTEIRLLLVIGNTALLFRPFTHAFGQKWLVFDVGGVIAIAGMLGMAVVSSLRHTVELYRAEPLPQESGVRIHGSHKVRGF